MVMLVLLNQIQDRQVNVKIIKPGEFVCHSHFCGPFSLEGTVFMKVICQVLHFLWGGMVGVKHEQMVGSLLNVGKEMITNRQQ
jgi:hypothetical protein